MIKIKHGYHEFDSSDTQQLYHAAHAYVHVPVRILVWNNHYYRQLQDHRHGGIIITVCLISINY
jgi:hypothetical protein